MKPPGTDAHAAGTGRTGVLVLSGSSGRVETQRCEVLAAGLDVTALSYRWFDPVLDLVALESFDEPLAWLHERCDRLVVLGTSRGAEAALLLGSLYAELDAVVGVSPSHVVWAALSDRRPQTSSWTWGGEPLPFVPYDDAWVATTDPPEYVGQYHSALERFADRVPSARIPAERIPGEVVVTSGGDDRLWPAASYADEIARERAAHGLVTVVLHEPAAGHRVLLPGETPQPARLVHGGDPAADAALGARLWTELARLTAR
jgi:hypothetical protein